MPPLPFAEDLQRSLRTAERFVVDVQLELELDGAMQRPRGERFGLSADADQAESLVSSSAISTRLKCLRSSFTNSWGNRWEQDESLPLPHLAGFGREEGEGGRAGRTHR